MSERARLSGWAPDGWCDRYDDYGGDNKGPKK